MDVALIYRIACLCYTIPMDNNIISRFWSNVEISKDPNACWEWKNNCSHPFGYARFGHSGKVELAHRFSYNIHNPPLKKGECVLHQCDNPKCVNPAHLKAGSRKDNANERVLRDRGTKGSSVPTSKLTEQQVLEIRSSKLPVSKLASLYNCSESNIYLIKSRGNWKHI